MSLGGAISTSLECLEFNRVAWRTLETVIGHNNVHVVVAVGEETGQGARKPRAIGFEALGLHPCTDAVMRQTTALSPVIHLRNINTNTPVFITNNQSFSLNVVTLNPNTELFMSYRYLCMCISMGLSVII